ncbi:hypothetical protein CAPTEDRAFT_197776 [Capitella teleta]|uniref:Peptidase C51 domain-containing protein n=1 Tax=Capitella teleta TaxID=283909 RepID=R7TJV7_CAPTE|nr:hypothetical protein CAPTEDRAFT_197776 [Capitella teleta]|eukprot:ELT94004.1 hypothetical protein CAPTEDRAFT_197776 [Capitella teleta]
MKPTFVLTVFAVLAVGASYSEASSIYDNLEDVELYIEERLSGAGSNTTATPVSSKGAAIAKKAQSYLHDTKWSKASSHSVGAGKHKCNIFIAEVIKEAGGSVPHRLRQQYFIQTKSVFGIKAVAIRKNSSLIKWDIAVGKAGFHEAYDDLMTLHIHFWWSPIGANEWANTTSSYLCDDKCWVLVTSPQNGDVAAGYGHVGIVTGPATTTSAGEFAVVTNDWGFGNPPRQAQAFWRYIC